MSTVCPSALSWRATQPSEPAASSHLRRWPIACWRALILCALLSVVFLPEFLHEGNGPGDSFVYGKAVAGFRLVDLGILALVLAHLAALALSRQCIARFPRTLAAPGAAFLLCIVAGIAYGGLHGGTNFFFDWRALALGVGLYFVWIFWIRTPGDVAHAVRILALYMAVRIALLYAMYLSGRGDTLLGIPIPTFDGPALSAIVFTALLALRYQESCASSIRRIFWVALAAAAYLIVLLCFRRTYWGEIALGTGVLLLLQPGHRVRNFVIVATMFGIAALALGKPFADRLQSVDVTQTEGEFSADNSDHLDDLQDAWDQVRASPVMGIGVGTFYSTWRIRNWKNESVMVHNAPIHVWLKYGAAGLACYLWFHIALLRWLYTRSRRAQRNEVAFLQVAFAYLTAQFVMTLGFAPWPYSELQRTTLMSFIVAAAVASASALQLRLPDRARTSI